MFSRVTSQQKKEIIYKTIEDGNVKQIEEVLLALNPGDINKVNLNVVVVFKHRLQCLDLLQYFNLK